MKNYRITVAYDGTRYKGWQVLKNQDATIQGKLQSVLESLAEEPVDVIGSGRTDAGVHAQAQIANFHMRWEDTPEALMNAINGYLPEDIAVAAIEEVEERFHSRYAATAKTYRYRIRTAPFPNVFERKYVYHYTDMPLDIAAMRYAAAQLVGTHDFASFCGNRKMKKSTVRTIYEIAITQEDGEIRIDYTGNGFLQNMVRILTGTLIEVGTHRREPESMTDILDARQRSAAGYTAPPQGLILMKVYYGKMDGIQQESQF